jgi:hypothetical protein
MLSGACCSLTTTYRRQGSAGQLLGRGSPRNAWRARQKVRRNQKLVRCQSRINPAVARPKQKRPQRRPLRPLQSDPDSSGIGRFSYRRLRRMVATASAPMTAQDSRYDLRCDLEQPDWALPNSMERGQAPASALPRAWVLVLPWAWVLPQAWVLPPAWAPQTWARPF